MPKKLSVSRTRSLRNIVDNPALPAVLERMQPKTLVRLIDSIGLNDAAELMALVPARNLLRALDEAMWKSPVPGASPAFDPAEFINWLQVWNEVGALFVSERLGAIGDEYLGLCLASVLQVGYGGAGGPTSDETEFDANSPDGVAGCADAESYQVYGHYLLRPVCEDDWEIIRAALDALWRHTPDHLLHILGTLATRESMLNADSRRTSLNLDVAFARERHLERRGYVSPSGALAFLASVAVETQELLMMSGYDNETRRFLEGIENHDSGQHPIENASATNPVSDELRETEHEIGGGAPTLPSQDQIKRLSRLLGNEAVFESKRFASLTWNRDELRRAVLAELLHQLEDENPEAFYQRTRELAYLAAVLMAGSALEDQPFTGGDARDAVLATCNLGVEFIQSRKIPLRLDTEPGLIRPFLIGWQLLSSLRDRVIDAMKTSFSDLETSPRLRNSSWLRSEARIGIRDLQSAVKRHHFTDTSDAVTFLSIVFDATACRELIPLLDHLPHLATRVQHSRNKHRPRWIESIADLDQVGSVLSRLTNE